MRLQAFWEARWILAFLALLAILSGLFSAWAFWFFVLLFLCTLAFFRDPDRAAPVDPNVIVAAADGTIMDIVELDENEVLKNKTRRVGIFLSVFDVHTNRAPIDGRVIYRQHRPGLCLDARRPDCSEKNESMTWAFENPPVIIVVRQITGAMGYMTESEISRMYRDSRLTSIGGGADEIMLGIISKGMGILPGQRKNH